MSNITSSMFSAASAMRSFEHALSVSQNNVANANTPGYARQRLSLQALPFSVEGGLSGGVTSGPLLDSRNAYADQSVRHAREYAGFYSQRETSLAQLEPVLEVGANAGLAASFGKFFQSFSALAISPSDPAAREVVLGRAASVAENFQAAGRGLSQTAQDTDQGLRDTTQSINTLASTLRDLNEERRRVGEGAVDPAIDAAVASTLEELSELVDFTALKQLDGTYTVSVGGREPLVIGDDFNQISADASGLPARILNSRGDDITAQIERGRLGALLDTRNRLLPTFQDDLDQLATEFADRVNTTLQSGLDAADASPAVDLFTYNPASAALSMEITAIQPQQLAAAAAGAPGGNGNALAIAALANGSQIDGQSFAGFYGGVAGKVGRELSVARESADRQEALLGQSTALRAELSGVSLDEEAVYLVQYQRSYQAAAQLFSVLNELTESTLAMLR